MEKKVMIEGMSCQNCAHHVDMALRDLEGVSNVNVLLEDKYALIEVESSVKDEDIRAAISDVGYEVTGVEVK